MISKTIGVAVIGTGRAGLVHARNFRTSVPRAHLAAIVEPDDRSREAARKELEIETVYRDYLQALEDPHVDAVVVVTPTHVHHEITVAAARAGRHILCEKPMAMTTTECEAMIDAAEREKVILQIGFMRRFDSGYLAARRALEEGVIGDLVQIKCLTHGPSVPQRWMYDIKVSNGPLAEVSSHDIDTMRWFTGSEFAEVHCVAGNYRCREIRDEFPDFYDTVLMTARFVNDTQGLVDGAVSVSYGYDVRTEILGTAGNLLIGNLGHDGVAICTTEGNLIRKINPSWRNLFSEAYLGEDRGFVSSILEGTPPAVGGRDGLEAVRVVNAGNRSITSGAPERVQQR